MKATKVNYFSALLISFSLFTPFTVAANGAGHACKGWNANTQSMKMGNQYRDKKGWFWLDQGDLPSWGESFPPCMGQRVGKG